MPGDNKMKKYNASLINDQGCSFDIGSFTNMKNLKTWVRDRGGYYSVYINTELLFTVRNNRLFKAN